MNREQLAWFTGLFEGEGTIYAMRRNGLASPMLAIGMTDSETVWRVETAMGHVGTIELERRDLPASDLYRWHTGSFEAVQAICAAMWPRLSRRRRAQITSVLSRCHTPRRVPRRGQHVPSLLRGVLEEWETEHPLEGEDFWRGFLGDELYDGLKFSAKHGPPMDPKDVIARIAVGAEGKRT